MRLGKWRAVPKSPMEKTLRDAHAARSLANGKVEACGHVALDVVVNQFPQFVGAAHAKQGVRAPTHVSHDHRSTAENAVKELLLDVGGNDSIERCLFDSGGEDAKFAEDSMVGDDVRRGEELGQPNWQAQDSYEKTRKAKKEEQRKAEYRESLAAEKAQCGERENRCGPGDVTERIEEGTPMRAGGADH